VRAPGLQYTLISEEILSAVCPHAANKTFLDRLSTLRMLGFTTADEVLGRHPKDTSPPFQPSGENSESASRHHIAECMEKGSARFDWVGLNARGEQVPFEVILTRVELGGRRVIQAVINDISERKKAEAQLRASEARLRESEARFSTAFHASPVLITVARLKDKEFVEVNEAFLSWMGLERAEIVGRNSEELDLWANLDERKGFFAELQRTRSLRNIESQLRRRDGAIRTVLISANIIEINGDPHVLGFGLDITESKRAEAELQKALATERELSQLIQFESIEGQGSTFTVRLPLFPPTPTLTLTPTHQALDKPES